MKMLNVVYWETPTARQCSNKYFGTEKSKEAEAAAKKYSKFSRRSARIYECSGEFVDGKFREFESTLKAVYTDGVKQKL